MIFNQDNSDLIGAITSVENGLAIIVTGDTCTTAVPSGGYAYIKNNTHGLTEGLYRNKTASAFPTSGGTANSIVFEAVSNGGLNAVLNTSPLKSYTVQGTTDASGNITISDISVSQQIVVGARTVRASPYYTGFYNALFSGVSGSNYFVLQCVKNTNPFTPLANESVYVILYYIEV